MDKFNLEMQPRELEKQPQQQRDEILAHPKAYFLSDAEEGNHTNHICMRSNLALNF